MSEKIIKEKTIEHPLEEIFDITPGSTIVEYKESPPTELVVCEKYDDKDEEIEEQFQNVYDKAMDAFDIQQDVVDEVEGKYVARNAEIAVQFLNAALNAAKEKSNMKQHKDKLGTPTGQPGSEGAKIINNNLFVDRNDLLNQILERGKREEPSPIDVTPENKE